MTTDKEHLQWIHDRIVEVYGENENIDFLHRMRKIIDKQDTELNLPDVSNFVLLTKPNYKAKDGTIKRGIEIDGKYYAPKNDC